MKTRQLLIILVSLIGLSSCGYKPGTPDDIIVGKYEVQSISITGCDDSTQNANLSNLAFECIDEGKYSICKSITVEFTNDRNYIFSRNRIQIDKTIGTSLNEEDPEIGFYSIKGNELNICFGNDCMPAQFSKDGKTLNLEIQRPNGCLEFITAIKQ